MTDDLKIPAGLQPGPLPQPEGPATATVDEMGVMNPVNDVSPRIEYLFYKCSKCGKKDFAGAGDTATLVDCTCYIRRPDPANRNDKGDHGKMRLMKYSVPRPGVAQLEDHSKPVGA